METPDLSHGIPPPGYRLPAAAQLGPVSLQVSDLARSIGYYERILGLRVLSLAAGAALLGVDADGRPLVELRERRGAHPVRRGSRLGLYHFAILLPDRAALGRFAEHASRLHVAVGSADHLVSESFYVWDPDGLGIEVYADRPREAWRMEANRQLVMATDPLDLDALVREGAGEIWQALPAGTSIGHVHLHVGDLERAADFYHAGLGFDRTGWTYPGALFLSYGGYHHHLGTNIWAAGAPSPTDRDAQLLAWHLKLPSAADVAAAGASLRERGYATTDADRTLEAADPWGTTIRISPAT